MVPVFQVSQFSYDKDSKVLLAEASELGIRPGPFPRELDIYSPHTRRTLRWVFDERKAERCEFWDGEEAHYLTHEPRCNAESLVIVND